MCVCVCVVYMCVFVCAHVCTVPSLEPTIYILINFLFKEQDTADPPCDRRRSTPPIHLDPTE